MSNIFEVLNLKKENFNGLAFLYCSRTEKQLKILFSGFLVMWKYHRKM